MVARGGDRAERPRRAFAGAEARAVAFRPLLPWTRRRPRRPSTRQRHQADHRQYPVRSRGQDRNSRRPTLPCQVTSGRVRGVRHAVTANVAWCRLERGLERPGPVAKGASRQAADRSAGYWTDRRRWRRARVCDPVGRLRGRPAAGGPDPDVSAKGESDEMTGHVERSGDRAAADGSGRRQRAASGRPRYRPQCAPRRTCRTKRRSSWRASGAALTSRATLRAQPPWRAMQSARART